jgi:hypothetical protein
MAIIPNMLDLLVPASEQRGGGLINSIRDVSQHPAMQALQDRRQKSRVADMLPRDPQMMRALASMPPQLGTKIVEQLMGGGGMDAMQGGSGADVMQPVMRGTPPMSAYDRQQPAPMPQQAPPAGFDAELRGGGFVDRMGGGSAEDQLNSGIRYPTDDSLTEGESKTIGYYRRALAANNELMSPDMETALTQWDDQLAGRFGALGRMYQDGNYQVANRAAEEFLAAVLRKDTGAAITNQEFDMYGPMYLPQPGDKPELLEAKRRARENALRAMEMGLSDAASLGAIARKELAPVQSDDEFLKSLGLE